MMVRTAILMEESKDLFGYEDVKRAFDARDAGIKAKLRKLMRVIFRR
jgi:hypothetical protein